MYEVELKDTLVGGYKVQIPSFFNEEIDLSKARVKAIVAVDNSIADNYHTNEEENYT